MAIILRFRFSLWIISFLLFFSFSESQAQNLGPTFVIESNGEQNSLHESALIKADLEKFRLRDSRRKLRFEDGVEIKLLSALELVELGALINPGNYQSTASMDPMVDYVFKVSESGSLAVRSLIHRDSKLSRIEADSPTTEARKVIRQKEFDQMKPEKQQHIINNPSLFIVK